MSGVFNFTFVPWFRSVAPYIHMHRGKTIVIGVPGEAIAAGKMAFRLGTPWGEFDTYGQLGAHLGKDPEKIKPLFARLNVVPRRPMLDFFGLENPSKLTWEGLGFTRIPK